MAESASDEIRSMVPGQLSSFDVQDKGLGTPDHVAGSCVSQECTLEKIIFQIQSHLQRSLRTPVNSSSTKYYNGKVHQQPRKAEVHARSRLGPEAHMHI